MKCYCTVEQKQCICVCVIQYSFKVIIEMRILLVKVILIIAKCI